MKMIKSASFIFGLTLLLVSFPAMCQSYDSEAYSSESYDSEVELSETDLDQEESSNPDDRDYSQNIVLESGETLPRSEASQAYLAEIETVLKGDDFAKKELKKGRRVKDISDEETREEKFPQWLIDFVRWFEGSGGSLKIIATLLEVLVWLAAISLIVFLVIRYRSDLRNWFEGMGSTEVEAELPTTLFGLDVKKDSLPEDVVYDAREHWAAGKRREGVATLLRASLILLLHEHSCQFFSSDTEAECCARIDQQAPPKVSAYMRQLVNVWQNIAYAHLDPSETLFDQLCEQWREVFR